MPNSSADTTITGTASHAGRSEPSRRPYLQRVLIAAGVVTAIGGLLALLWYGTNVLLLIFAGLLLGVFLRSLADWVSQYTPLRPRWSLALVVVLLLALFGAGAWLLLPTVQQQAQQLTQQLPSALQQVRQQVQQLPFAQQLIGQAPQPQQLVPRSTNVLGQATGIFSTLLGIVTNVVIIIVIGIYFAANPGLYQRGLLRLIPRTKRDRANHVLQTLGYTLRWWLVGRIAIMTVNGIITALGLWFMGVPLPVLNGILTGLLNFIPNIGPLIAAVPPVLLAFTQGPTLALWVVVLYIVIQNLEGFVLTPLVQERTVELPPVLIISAQIFLGVLFGFLGVLLAVPLTAVVFVLVKMLYVEDTLGDDIGVKGEGRSQQQSPV